MNSKKTILATVVLFIVVILTFAACKKEGLEPIVVTDAFGNPVTDEHGEVITVIPEVEVIELTDINGVPVTDENGEVLTTIRYIPQDVPIPVTDGNGNAVTNPDGSVVTTYVVVPVESTTNLVITVPVTDENGETQTDASGNVVTQTTIPNIPEGTPSNNILNSSNIGGTGSDEFIAAKDTSDGGYVALIQSNSRDGALSVNSGYSSTAGALVKYNKNGKQEWIAGIGGNKSTQVSDLFVDGNGNIYVCGQTKANSFVSVHGKEYDAFIQKYSSGGQLAFTKHWGGTQNETFYSVAAAPDGSIYAVGAAYSNDGDCQSLGLGDGEACAVIVKFNSNGSLVSAKGYGAFGDYFSDIDINDFGEIYVSAVLSSKLSESIYTSKGYSDVAVFKFNSDLSVSKSSHWGGTYIDTITSLTALESGGFVVVGFTSSADGDVEYLGNKGGKDAMIMKWTKDCQLAWVKTFAGTGDDQFTGVAECADGSIMAVGYSTSANRDFKMVGNLGGSDGFVAKYDAGGELLQAQCFGGSNNDQFNDVCVLTGGQTVTIGKTLSSDGYLANLTPKSDGKNPKAMMFIFRF